MKRAALIAGISISAMLCAAMAPAAARTLDVQSWWSNSSRAWTPESPPKKARRHSFRSDSREDQKAEKAAPLPSGQLHIIVSINTQRATLFADGVPVASSAISSGTPGHPTPMGVFTVIQKDRYHVSNLYDAAMPYMQRITWSGSALHQGPLPGYPASHGCVRLTTDFAQLLWRSTKLGARVIVTKPDVAPIEFSSPWLTLLMAKPAAPPSSPEPQVFVPALTSSLTKTADATGSTPPVRPRDDAKPLEPAPAANADVEQPTKLSANPGENAPQLATTVEAAKSAEAAKPAETAKPVEPAAPPSIIVEDKPATVPATIVRPVKRKPISVFVSLKERKLYVRQGWEALFDVPVTIANPDQPIGTHVYTAMGMKADGDFRWTVVSIPSGYKRMAEAREQRGRKSRNEHVTDEMPSLPSPNAALDRITIPPDVAERIAGMMMPGSSLIVSDNRLSDETDKSTDFIVLTH